MIAAIFALPACHPAASAPPVPDAGVVPFTIDTNGLIRIEATLGDTLHRSLIFDTGAGIDVLAPTLITALHAVPAGWLEAIRMTGERIPIPLYRIDRLRLGPLEWTDVLVGRAEFLDRMGLPGIISLNDFRDRSFTLDFSRNEFIPESRSAVAVRESQGLVVPIRTDDLRGEAIDIFADFVLAGERGECEIDTGSQGPTVSTRFLASLGIDSSGPSVRVGRSTTIGGAVQVRYGTTIPYVALAADTAFRQAAPRVTFSDIVYDCVIGRSWWKGRSVTIDLPRRHLILNRLSSR